MGLVYSTQFMAGHAGFGPSYTVPAGKVAVLRSFAVFNANAVVAQAAQLHLTTVPCTVAQVDLGPQVSDQIDMRVVVLPGDTVVMVLGADCDGVLSGYLLSTP